MRRSAYAFNSGDSAGHAFSLGIAGVDKAGLELRDGYGGWLMVTI